jgi:hypothetical protein
MVVQVDAAVEAGLVRNGAVAARRGQVEGDAAAVRAVVGVPRRPAPQRHAGSVTRRSAWRRGHCEESDAGVLQVVAHTRLREDTKAGGHPIVWARAHLMYPKVLSEVRTRSSISDSTKMSCSAVRNCGAGGKTLVSGQGGGAW